MSRSRRAQPALVERLTPADWIKAARKALIRGGVAAVKVDQLAAELSVTRGSFYWHFSGRAALLDAVLSAWGQSNTSPFIAVLDDGDADGLVLLRRYLEVWVGAADFDPAYDAAVRDWARSSADVASLVRRTDDVRTKVLDEIFRRIGYEPGEAMIRARVTYYHQIGYYALGIVESQRRRRQLLPIYFKVLSGHPMPREDSRAR